MAAADKTGGTNFADVIWKERPPTRSDASQEDGSATEQSSKTRQQDHDEIFPPAASDRSDALLIP